MNKHTTIMKQDPTRFPAYRIIKQANHQGLLKDIQAELLLTALSNDLFIVDFVKGVDGKSVSFTVETKGKID